MLTFLIMAGGSGERFWPLSTKSKPKQLLKVFSNKSLIRLTYERILPLVDKNQIFIATNEIQVDALKSDLTEVPTDRIIIEPLFRDTAAAIAYGSMIISKYYANPTICIIPSDALIQDDEEFRKVIKIAEEDAENDKIVTLGMKPTYPETGYGYIQVSEAINNKPTEAICFKEKPNLELAKTYFESNKYLWNSGMFIFKHNILLEALKKYSPSHYDIISKISEKVSINCGVNTANSVKSDFQNFEKKSIDFAVMEYAKNIDVIPASFGWNDVGNYIAFEELFKKDDNGNVIRNINCISIDSNDNIIVSDSNVQRVSLLGVKNMVIAVTENEILVCAKDKTQQIKEIIKKIG